MKSAFLYAQLLICLLPQFCAAQTGGVPPEWDIRETLTSLTAEAQRAQSILEQVSPKQWLAKGAPEAYIKQHEAIRNEIGYLDQTATKLSRQPDRITLALEVFLRLQSMEEMMQSLMEGIRRYQNPALADLLQSTVNENSNNVQKLRDYLVALVAIKETEFEIADREAQRCRAEQIGGSSSSIQGK